MFSFKGFFTKKVNGDKVYAYHNLGLGIFPEGEEKTPHGAGERYNFDRMYFMVSNYDFYNKNVIDIGCNSGWFCFQAKLLGAKNTVGIDYEGTGLMGTAVKYSKKLEQRFKLGMKFYNQDLEYLKMPELLKDNKIEAFDCAIVLSVMHHIHDKRALFEKLYDNINDVIFYEDHEFWNDLKDYQGNSLELKGEGYRFGWNEDMSWQRKMMPLETIEQKIIESYMNSSRKNDLMLDKFEKIQVLGLSEKRRPMLALWKSAKNS